MPTLRNISASVLVLPNNLGSIGAGQSATISDDVMGNAGVRSWIRDGFAAVHQGQVTRDDFASMSKADLAEVLEAHGVDFDGRLGAEKLRDLALRVVFMEV